MSSGCPTTHSNPLTPCACAPRWTWTTRPPLLRSQRAIDPADEAVASIGGPSVYETQYLQISIRIQRTHSECQRGNTTIIHLDLHNQLALTDIKDADTPVEVSYSDDIDSRRLDQGRDGGWTGRCRIWESVNERATVSQ